MSVSVFQSTAAAPGLRMAIGFARALAALLVVSGLLALVGFVSGMDRLAAPVAGWSPMRPLSALCVIGLGIGLWGRIVRRTSLVLTGAGAALALAVVVLLSFAIRQTLPLGGQPLPSAVLVASAAVGLLSGVNRLQPGLEQISLGVAGLVLVALSVTVGFARVVGIFSSNTRVGDTSFQMNLGMGLLGLCFLALVWASDPKDLEPPPWLPATTALAGLITVGTLWNGLVARDFEQRAETGRLASLWEERLLIREVHASAGRLRGAAQLAESGVALGLEMRGLEGLRRDIAGFESGIRVAADGTALLAFPPTAAVDPVLAVWRTFLGESRTPPDTVVYLPFDRTASRFIIFAPVCPDRCGGAVAAVIRTSKAFEAAVRDSTHDVRFSLAGPDGPIEGMPLVPAGVSSRERKIGIGGVDWRLSTWPTADRAAGEGNLPGTVLFMGLTVTILLPLTMHLARSAWLGARERERARLSFALDRSTDGLWELDLLTGQVARSQTIWKNLQYESKPAPAGLEEWTSLIHPDDRPIVRQRLARHLAGDSDTFETEYRIRAGDGSWHILVDRGRIVDRTAVGSPARILGISADVTESRANAEARDASDRRFRAVFNSGFQYEILLSREGLVLEVNQVTLDRTGITAEQVLGVACWDALWWAGNPAAQTILRRAWDSVAGGGGTETWRQEIPEPGRPPMVLEVSLRPIQGLDGFPGQVLLEARDITERLKIEATLREVSTLTTMGGIAARVAHEINNPLAGIQAAFLLIKDAVPKGHPHFAYVGAIEREIGRIANVTQQLYETYRPEQDTTGIASVQLIAADVVAFLGQINRSRAVTIATDFSQVPGTVAVSAAILRQIFFTLIQNAVDVSPAGGTVTIIAMASPTMLELRVRDQGPGVPPGLNEQIFEPFFSTKEKGMDTSGMGLGLALVRQTVAATGGSIAVGAAPGPRGAEFVVTLPLKPVAKGGPA